MNTKLDLSPLFISIKTSLLATLLTFIFGIYCAYLLANSKSKFKGVIDGLITLPLVLPPTVVGFILLLLLGNNSLVGEFLNKFDITIIFSWTSTVIAATIVAFPMMYRSSRAAFEQIDSNIISAAKTLGLNHWHIFFKIAIPLAWPGIIGGLILSFARAMGEFGATLMIAGNIPGKTQTIPLAIFFSVESGEMNKAIFWVVIIILLSLLMIIALNYWCEKSLKFMGRRKQ